MNEEIVIELGDATELTMGPLQQSDLPDGTVPQTFRPDIG